MPCTYKFDKENQLAYIITEGEVTTNDFISRNEKMLNDPLWSKSWLIISDFTNANLSNIHENDMVKIFLELLKHREKLIGMPIAYVAPKDCEFGLLRMWEKLEAEKLFSEVRVFRTKTEAITWLKSLTT